MRGKVQYSNDVTKNYFIKYLLLTSEMNLAIFDIAANLCRNSLGRRGAVVKGVQHISTIVLVNI